MSVFQNRRGKPSSLPQSASNARTKRTRRHLALDKLEERVVLSYVFTYNAGTNTATATQSVSGANPGDSLVIEDNGGFLDWSVNGSAPSGNWGGLSVPDSPTLTVNIQQAAGAQSSVLTGPNSVTFGSPTFPASKIASQFITVSGAVTDSALTVDDSTGTLQATGVNAYSYDGHVFNGPGQFAINVMNVQNDGVTLLGNSQPLPNTFNVPGDAANETVTFIGGSGANTVNVGTGGLVSGINAALSVQDPSGVTTLNVNNQADAANATATLDNLSGNPASPFEITGLSPAPIEFGPGTDITAVNINGGPGPAGVTYNLNHTSTATLTITDGAGPDTVNVGDPTDTKGIEDVTGPVVVVGGGNTAINVDDSGFNGTGSYTYALTDTTLTTTGFPFGGLTYSGASALTLKTGTTGTSVVDVNNTANGIPTTIDSEAPGGTVNVNGTGSGVGSGLTVNTSKAGGSTVNLLDVNEPTTINTEVLGLAVNTAPDTVNVGFTTTPNRLVTGIQAPVNITTGFFYGLNFNDQDDATGQTWTVGTGSVQMSGSQPVTFLPGDLTQLTLNGGSGGNTFNVSDIPGNGVTTTLNAGAGTNNNTVNVTGTSAGATLNIDAQGGASNNVVLGNAPGVGAQGLIDATTTINVEDSSGQATLSIDDSQDATGQSVNISSFGAGTTVKGIAPATINYNVTGTGVSALVISGGSGGNTFTVNGTDPNGSTTLNTGSGADTTNVLATSATGPLFINGQDGADTVNLGNPDSLLSILGPVTITNAKNFTDLEVNGSADTNAHNIKLVADVSDTTATFTGLTPNTVTYTIGDISQVGITLGNAGASSNNLTIDFHLGNPIQFLNNPGLNYDAGSGAANTLKLEGTLPGFLPAGISGFASEVHDANGPGFGDISLTDNNGNGSGLIYSGLAVDPINDSADATNYTFNDNATPDGSFNAINSPNNVNGFSPGIQFNSASVPPGFTTTNIANKANVVFNANIPLIGVNGTVNIPNAPTGTTPLQTLTFNTIDAADNTVSFVNTPPGVATSLMGSTEEDVTNVRGAGVATGTTLVVNGSANQNTLNYDATGGFVQVSTTNPITSATAGPNEVFIYLTATAAGGTPISGVVDALNYTQINVTGVSPLTITPVSLPTYNTVEGFQNVDQLAGEFQLPLAPPFITNSMTGASNPAGVPASDFTATINWGDPSPDTAAGTVAQDASNPSVYYITGTHTFPTTGTFTASSFVGFSGATVTAAVNGVPISVTYPAIPAPAVSGTPTTTRTFAVSQGVIAVTALPIIGTEGTAIPAGPIATFIDAAGADLVGNYSATITITNSSGATVFSGAATGITQVGNSAQYTVNAPAITLSPSEEGTYQVTVTVTDSDGTAPQASGVSTATIADAALTAVATPAGAHSTGQTFTAVVGNFSDANASAPLSDFTAVIDWGDGSPTSLGTIGGAAGAYTVTGTHAYGKPGNYNTKIVVTDVGGSTVTLSNTLGASAITVTDQAVTGSVHNFSAVEGQNTGTIVLATFTDPNPLSTVASETATLPVGGWGDTSPGSVVTLAVQQIGTSAAGNVFEVLGSHTYAEEGTDTVNITVTTSGGVSTNLTAGTATVADAPLTSAGATVTGTEGTTTPTETVATFTDANPNATTTDFTASIVWGDGATTSGTVSQVTGSSPNGVSFTVSGSHNYAEEGTFPISVTISDDGGSKTVASSSAVIADAALSAGATVALTPNTGVPLATPPGTVTVGNFTDANTGAPASDFTAVIDWGDGTATSLGTVAGSGGAYTVAGNHTYAKPGNYATTIVVTDVGGSKVTLTGSATVTDKAVVAGPALTIHPVEGIDTGTIRLATFTDPNPLATASDLSAVLTTWGDSTPTSPVPVTLNLIGSGPSGAVFEVLGSHTYAEENTPAGVTYSITVTTSGTAPTGAKTTTLTGTAVVVDAPLTSAGGSVTGTEGITTPSQTVATFADQNPGATGTDFTATINWGDGSTSAGTVTQVSGSSANGVSFSVAGSHQYTEEGTFATTITIVDDGGATTVAHGTATIADAALTASATPPTVATTEGQPFTGAVASFTDANPLANVADFTYVSINWGDGTPATSGTVSLSGGVFSVNGTHTYANTGATGSFPITVQVHDVGGSTLTIANSATVGVATTTLIGALNPATDTGVSNSDAITADQNPDFFGFVSTTPGTSPVSPLETIKLTATNTVTGVTTQIGQGEADAHGAWNIVSSTLPQGTYTITATAFDPTGNQTGTVQILPNGTQGNLVIDTAGPKVANVTFNRATGTIFVTYQDNLSGANMASIMDANNYFFSRVGHGSTKPGLITSITTVPTGVPGQVEVALNVDHNKFIKGGNFNFVIYSEDNANPSGVQDVAGNAMDGEFYGFFPSGNNVNGGNFVAELTAFHNLILPPRTRVGTATPVEPPGTVPPITFTNGQTVPLPSPLTQNVGTARGAVRLGQGAGATVAGVLANVHDTAIDQIGPAHKKKHH